MKKTWNITTYREGKPFSERHGVSQRDALTQIYFLSHTGVQLEAPGEIRPSAAKDAELDLVA